MRRLMILGVFGALVVSLSACGGSSAGSASEQEDTQRQADLYAISQIQTTFHKALSTKDIELMMSVWAPNATITAGPGQTLAGMKKIREHWLNSNPFQPPNRWVAETPTYKTRATANGDRGTLFFECHLIDAKTAKVVVISGADTQVARIDGRWLITRFVGATGTLSP
jgi:ketosteroid isomerase-like protein